jgi:hypothetical protein
MDFIAMGIFILCFAALIVVEIVFKIQDKLKKPKSKQKF